MCTETISSRFMACGAISCEVHALVMDAGGNDATVFKLLRNGIASEELWLPEDMLLAINHVRTNRKIFMWHCSIHVFKALRSAFLSSRKNGAKSIWVAVCQRLLFTRQETLNHTVNYKIIGYRWMVMRQVNF